MHLYKLYFPIMLIDDEITDNNWRYIFQETLNQIRENKLDDGARPLQFDGSCKIRIKKLGDISFTFPLSNALCSRIICEHGVPLPLSNKYDFCGIKVTKIFLIKFFVTEFFVFYRLSIQHGKSIIMQSIFLFLSQLLFDKVHSNNFI